VAESRRAFLDLIKYAPPEVQRRLHDLLNSLVFKDELKITVGAAAAKLSGYTVSNATTDRTFNADSLTVNELADVVGTLINDLQS